MVSNADNRLPREVPLPSAAPRSSPVCLAPTRLAICCHCGHTKRKVWRSGDGIYLVQASPPFAVTMHRSGTV